MSYEIRKSAVKANECDRRSDSSPVTTSAHLTNQGFCFYIIRMPFPQEIPINGTHKTSIRQCSAPTTKCWENAKSQSFYARDNVSNFLKWCRKFGVRDAVLFERYVHCGKQLCLLVTSVILQRRLGLSRQPSQCGPLSS